MNHTFNKSVYAISYLFDFQGGLGAGSRKLIWKFLKWCWNSLLKLIHDAELSNKKSNQKSENILCKRIKQSD